LKDFEDVLEKSTGLFGITRFSDGKLEIPIMGFRFKQTIDDFDTSENEGKCEIYHENECSIFQF